MHKYGAHRYARHRTSGRRVRVSELTHSDALLNDRLTADGWRCVPLSVIRKKINFVNTHVDFVRRRSAAAGLNFVVLHHALL
jgi:hypothetical protein